jgi:hypothetical protein
MSNQGRQFIETLELEIPQKDQLFRADSENNISSDLSTTDTIAVPVKLHLLLRRNLCKPVNH